MLASRYGRLRRESYKMSDFRTRLEAGRDFRGEGIDNDDTGWPTTG